MTKRLLLPILLGALTLIVWEIGAIVFHVPQYLLPRPSAVIASFAADWKGLLAHAGLTLSEAVLGFAIANVAALALAVLMSYVRDLNHAVMPLAIALKTTPIVAMAPLLLLWLGTGLAPKVAASALICFFPALVNAVRGFHSLGEGEFDLFRVYGASRTTILLKLRFFRAAPYIMSALKVSSSLAIVGAIVGEFVGANAGIGYVILTASYHLETPRMFAGLALAALGGLVLYGALAFLDKKLVFWTIPVEEELIVQSPISGASSR